MPKLNPFVAQFLAIVAVLVALFGWLRTEMGELRAGQIELLERVVRLETGQGELRAEVGELMERVARIEAGQASAGERMARIEGTVAGALGRPFPGADRPAEAPDSGVAVPESGE